MLQSIDFYRDWRFANRRLASSHAAGVRIIGCAAGDGQHADATSGDLVFRRGFGGLGCGDCTGEDEDDNKRANDMFHKEIPPKLYSCKKISLDKPDVVTIGYKLN